MRRSLSIEKLKEFMKQVGKTARTPGKVFFTGGSTALLLGFREQTIDIDLKLHPEPGGIFNSIAQLKNDLDINVELASPADFIPVPDDWEEKSVFIERIGKVDFYHFDLYSQALAKIERGYEQDLKDVRDLVSKGFIEAQQIKCRFADIQSNLIRFPAIDPAQFEKKVADFLTGLRDFTDL